MIFISSAVENDDELRALCSDRYTELEACGITSTYRLRMEDSRKTVRLVILHHTLLKAKAEIDQFISGLCLGTRDVIIQHPLLMLTFFTKQGMQVLNAVFLTVLHKELYVNRRFEEPV